MSERSDDKGKSVIGRVMKPFLNFNNLSQKGCIIQMQLLDLFSTRSVRLSFG